jgi:hypothetical protein
MVRIDVTPNVTFTGSNPSTRENITTGGCLSARRAAMRILRCNCVEDMYRSGGAAFSCHFGGRGGLDARLGALLAPGTDGTSPDQ